MTSTAVASSVEPTTVGRLIQEWRRARNKSQIALALQAGISAKHLGFVEIGRAHPSHEMVLLLAGVLDVPLRERNTLLLAAGYAPRYTQTRLDDPELAHAVKAVQLILQHQEPYPAVVMDRHWNLLTANGAADWFFGLFVTPPAGGPPANILRLMFDPAGLRPHVANWESVAEALIQRVHREALGGQPDTATAALLQEVLAYPGVPKRWRSPTLAAVPKPYLVVKFRKGEMAMDFFSTVTTLGTPLDVTLQELRIECFFPADEPTVVAVRTLRGA